MHAEAHEMTVRRDDIVAAAPLIALGPLRMAEELGQGKPAGVMRMGAIDHIGERRHLAAVDELKRDVGLAVDGSAFAPGEIGQGRGAIGGLDSKTHTDARAATVEPEYQPWTFGRAAIFVREQAKRAVIAKKPRRMAFSMRKTGPPHQRA